MLFRSIVLGLGLVLVVAAAPARADVLAGLVPADDAREAIAIGPAGEVYAPSAGTWQRTQRIATATRIEVVGRAGDVVIAAGGGVVYRLAPNGWSALRLAQRGDAIASAGPRAVAAAGRQLYALDGLDHGSPAKLAAAPAPVRAVGAGKTIIVDTRRGLYRIDGRTVTKLARAPTDVKQLVGDRWAITGRGAVDLRTGATIAWPAGGAPSAVALGPGDALVAVGTLRDARELWIVRGRKLERVPVPAAPAARAVGVALDRAGRAVIALTDGTLLVRAGEAWTTTAVRDALPPPRPGPGPARSR